MPLLQLDLALKDPETGGDISSFITNGEWELIGKQDFLFEYIYFSIFPLCFLLVVQILVVRKKRKPFF
jgi:nicotinic acetylcholine receptor